MKATTVAFEQAGMDTVEHFPDTHTFPCELLDIFPQYWNDFPAEHWPYHGEDDPNYDRSQSHPAR